MLIRRGLPDKMEKVLATLEKGLKQGRAEEARKGRVSNIYKRFFAASAAVPAVMSEKHVYFHAEFLNSCLNVDGMLPEGRLRVTSILNAQVVVTGNLAEHNDVQGILIPCSTQPLYDLLVGARAASPAYRCMKFLTESHGSHCDLSNAPVASHLKFKPVMDSLLRFSLQHLSRPRRKT